MHLHQSPRRRALSFGLLGTTLLLAACASAPEGAGDDTASSSDETGASGASGASDTTGGGGGGAATATDEADGDDAGSATAVATCPEGTIPDEDGTTCVRADDATPADLDSTSPVGIDRVDLGEAPPGVRGDGTEPTFGVYANKGRLRTRSSSRMYGTMTVRRTPWAWSDGYARQTAANRTQRGAQLRAEHGGGIVDGGGLGGGTVLSIVDLSCSSAYPCRNGATVPTSVWEEDVASMASCYLHAQSYGTYGLRYIVASTKTDTLSPPHWTNRVYFYDFCRAVYVTVYAHTFRANQRDCSVYNDCGYELASVLDLTGPAGATIATPRTIGFSAMSIIDDGVRHSLSGTTDTHWVPAPSWWTTRVTPNYAFTATRL